MALERFLLKILRKRKADGISQELASTNGDDLGDEWETRSSKMELVENQPGAGRTLDLAITAAGVRLERGIGKAAAKLGFGPDAVMERVWKQIPSYRDLENHYSFLLIQSLSMETSFIRDCIRLIRYAR